MSHQFTEPYEPSSPKRMSEIVPYTARIQEAMRYDKLSASDYRLVMTIKHAVSQGLTEEQWKAGQDKTIHMLIDQPPDKVRLHADATNQYEQTVACFKDLVLWPW